MKELPDGLRGCRKHHLLFNDNFDISYILKKRRSECLFSHCSLHVIREKTSFCLLTNPLSGMETDQQLCVLMKTCCKRF